LLTTILGLVSDASGQKVEYITGLSPDRPYSPTYEISAQNETARSVLLRAQALMQPLIGPMAWDLLYDPESRTYFMNYTWVPRNSPPTTTPVPSNSGATQHWPSAVDDPGIKPQ